MEPIHYPTPVYIVDLPVRVTRRERFLAEMDRIMPWNELVAMVEPHYDEKRGYAQPGLERVLRVYLLQQWFKLSAPEAEDEMHDSSAMQHFVGIGPGDVVPDETTLLGFRRLLERHRLVNKIRNLANERLREQGLLVRSGAIANATIMIAPKPAQ